MKAQIVELRDGQFLDAGAGDGDKMSMWVRHSRATVGNLEVVRIYQRQRFKGFFWVATRFFYMGEELYGNWNHVTEFEW